MNIRTREDGYMNVITGMGTLRDPHVTTFFQQNQIFTEPMLATIFSDDGIGRKIVEGPAEEMIRPWFEVKGDEGKAIADRLEEIGARESFVEAIIWARLYGGSVAVFVTDDGGSLEQPLRQFDNLLGIKVFDRYRVRWENLLPSSDPIKRLSGIPEVVTVTPPNGLAPQKIHESRFVIIPGARVPELIRQRNGGWDNSVLQATYDSIKRYASGLGYTSNILRDFVQSVLSVKGLTELLAADKDDVVTRRLQLLDLSRSILNTMIIDADGEEYSKSASSVAGLSDVIDRYVENLSMVTGIPAAKLMGRTPGGLGATGQSDMQNYYDMLASERARECTELAERTVKLIYMSKQGPTSGTEPEAWSIRWSPFYQPTEKETAELRKQVADTDKIYLEMQVVTPKEVAESRFGGDEWSMETQIEDLDKRPDDFEPEEPEEPEEEVIAPAAVRKDATPRSLYVRRDVINATEILAWARKQGFKNLEKPSELHVTIAFSRTPVDWMKVGVSWSEKVEVPAGGPRILESFGEAQVLLFDHHELKWRHDEIKAGGASWDFSDYQPHITLCYGEMPTGAEPYQGRIILGPEIFEEVDENWRGDGFNPNQPRDAAGRWTSTGGGVASAFSGPGRLPGQPKLGTSTGKVWEIGQGMDNPTRQELIDAAVKQGVAPGTAATQASRYLAARKAAASGTGTKTTVAPPPASKGRVVKTAVGFVPESPHLVARVNDPILMASVENKVNTVYNNMPDWMKGQVGDVDVEVHGKDYRSNAQFAPNRFDNVVRMGAGANADVVAHEYFHIIDDRLSGNGRAYGKRGSMEWNTDDPKLNTLAAEARREFISRDGQGTGKLSGETRDSAYALGNWRQNYEARIYSFDKDRVSSEYLTMGAQQYYRQTRIVGATNAAQVARHPKTQRVIWNKHSASYQDELRVAPARLALLDYMFGEKE